MRRRDVLIIGAAALSGLAAATAHGDVVMPAPRRVTLTLERVDVLDGDAPEADRAAVARAVRRALGEQRPRLRRCLADVDLREDPFRSRARRLVGEMTFRRGPRPDVRLVRADGLPAAARGCVMELARAIAAPAPRGSVRLRFVYVAR